MGAINAVQGPPCAGEYVSIRDRRIVELESSNGNVEKGGGAGLPAPTGYDGF